MKEQNTTKEYRVPMVGKHSISHILNGKGYIFEANFIEENATLFDNAKEMLSACKCALADLEGVVDNYPEHPMNETIAELMAVIKKIEEK